MKAAVQEFLEELDPKLCVLSTIGRYKHPESAVMAYAMMDDLSVVLTTHDDSRKYHNIKRNPNVALTFGWDLEGQNVQYEGTAKLVEESEEIERIYDKANPEHGRFRDLPGMVFVLIKPRWIRFSDFSTFHPKIKEMKFD